MSWLRKESGCDAKTAASWPPFTDCASGAPSFPRQFRRLLLSANEPRDRDQEQRREEDAKEGVDPDQGNVETAEAETDPESAERSVRFQRSSPVIGNGGEFIAALMRGEEKIGGWMEWCRFLCSGYS